MITQQQIARKLGLSRQLVSLALAGYPQVSAESRERILAAAQEMGYRPNPHARALKHGRTGLVALWIPDQISAHYNHVSREFGRLVKQAQCELIVVEVGVQDVEQVVSHVPVDAVVAVDAPNQVAAYLQTPAAKFIPIVGMGAVCCQRADSVQIDLLAGTAELMEHLLGSGFRRIAHMKYERNNLPEASRELGYVRAMRQARLKPEFIEMPFTDKERAVARETISNYLQKGDCPEVIFCHCDDVALGAYRGLCDLGLRVPAEVALAGCDGIDDVEYLECPLTTIAQPVGEMCATAWQFVQQRLEGGQKKRQRAVLRPKLLVRESTLRNGLGGADPKPASPGAPGTGEDVAVSVLTWQNS